VTLIPAATPGDNTRSAAKLVASRALARFKTPGMNLSDREFLAPALEILETPPSPVHVAFLWIICAFVVPALAWAYFGRVDIRRRRARQVSADGTGEGRRARGNG